MRRRGFTLAEMMVVIFLLLIVGSMVAQVMVPSLIMFRLGTSRSDVQQGPMIFSHFMQRMLMNAPVESVAIGTSPTAIAWLDVREEAPYDISTGDPRTADAFSIVWFDRAAGRVWAKRWPPAPPSLGGYDLSAPSRVPPVLSAADLRQICGTRNGTERVLVKDVSDLAVTDDAGLTEGLLVLPLRLSITCSQRSGARDEKPESFTLTTRVSPRSTRW